MLCTQFYCNTPTHQESVWIHISVVSPSHFVITPSQSKSICPPLVRANCLSHTDLIIENGYSGKITIDHVEEIVNSLKVSFVNRRYFYMNEFKIGLNAYGLGDLISSHPDICKPFFLEEFHDEAKVFTRVNNQTSHRRIHDGPLAGPPHIF